MQSVDPAELRRRNLSYRDPALYDELLADSDSAARITRMVDRTGATVQTVVDFGCGTGRDLAELHASRGWKGYGVDAQPELLTYAAAHHPEVDFVTADITAVRLGTTFDLIMSVGNTLSYLHTKSQVAAACETFAAHAHAGSLLVIGTMLSAGGTGVATTQIVTSLGEAWVETRSTWDAGPQIQTTIRTWNFADGRTEHDRLIRRVHVREELVERLTVAGLEPLAVGPADDYELWAIHRP